MAKTGSNKSAINDAIIKSVRESIHGLNSGTVTISVDDARIVQIEVAQKTRFHHIWTLESGAGI